MSRPRWRKVVRDLTSHKVRTALVVLSIAVGVFAVAIVMGGRAVLIREFDADFAASVPSSAEFDTSDFSAPVLKSIAERDDIRAAEGRRRVSLRYTLGSADGGANTDWDTLRLWSLEEFDRAGVTKVVREEGGVWPPRAGEVVLERSALQVADLEIGDTLTVESSTGDIVALRIVGFAHDINAIPAQFQHALTGFVSPETLPLLDEPDELNHISVVMDPSLSQAAASRIAADVRDTDLSAAGVQVYRTSVPKPGSHFLGDIFRALSLLLLAMGVMALALSAFLVVTTVSAIMTQQVRQVGIMKAIGGRREQISLMYLALVAGYGVLAVALGVGAGLPVGRMFIRYAAGVLNFRVTDFNPPTWVIVLEVVIGLLVPIAAAALPVRRGSLMPVARALNAASSAVSFGHGLFDRLLGLLVSGLPRPVALSVRNTFLRKGRLALTLTTLVLASAVVMAVLSVRTSILQTVDDIGAWWNYDAQVFLGRPGPGTDIERAAEKAVGVTAVETWLESAASIEHADGSENEDVYVLGIPQGSRFITPRIVAGRWLENGEDEIVINTDIAKNEPNLDIGDTMRLTMNGEDREWKLVGIATGQLMGPVAFADREVLDAVVGANGAVSRVLAQSENHDADSQARVARDLERRLDDAGIAVSGTQTMTAQRESIGSQLGILVTFLVIMAALLAAVGVIGLTGTMTINVLESTREIGVMRSIGASHGWVFYIFITEGIVIAVMAWALGAILSWPFSIWLVDALGKAMSLPLSYAFSWLGVVAWLLLVVVIAAVASVLPAWRASQVSIRDAIAYE